MDPRKTSQSPAEPSLKRPAQEASKNPSERHILQRASPRVACWGEGSPRCRRGGGGFGLKIPGGGVVSQEREGWARSREGVCGIWGGGGAKCFFFGAEVPCNTALLLNEASE